MKIIVCGLGEVGFNLAQALHEENHEVVVIDEEQARLDKVRQIQEGIRTVLGQGASPEILQLAGVRKADLLIAVTDSDEMNIVLCQVAHYLFNVPQKIARIRNQGYLSPIWKDLFSADHLVIDEIISPEVRVAQSLLGRLSSTALTDRYQLCEGQVEVFSLRLSENSPLLGAKYAQLPRIFPDILLQLICVLRDNQHCVFDLDMSFQKGDHLYFCVQAQAFSATMEALGHTDEPVKSVVLLGAGNVGVHLAQFLSRDFPEIKVKLIESDQEKAQDLADLLPQACVLQGDALNPELLDEANISISDAVISLTNHDQVNLLSAFLAKQAGCGRAFALIQNSAYLPFITKMGIDGVVCPHKMTLASILTYVRPSSIKMSMPLQEGEGEILEIEINKSSKALGMMLEDFPLASEVRPLLFVRGGQVKIPAPTIQLQVKDRLLYFVPSKSVSRFLSLFTRDVF